MSMAGGVRGAGRWAGRGGVAEGTHDQDSAPLAACLTHSGLRALAGVPYIYMYTHILIYIYTHVNTYTHMYVYIYTYIHM